MDRTATETTIKYFLTEIRERLEKCASIAVAAEACANAGQVSKAVSIAMDAESLTYEADRLLAAAVLFRRISRQQEGLDPCED